jgi:type IV pilus assembly protein PilM
VNIPKLDILVVAIHNDTLARFSTIVEKAELKATFFEIELFSTMRAVVDEPLRPVLIMDIGAASTKIYVVERGIVKASHTINRGAQDITKTISQSLGIAVEKAEVAKREYGLTGDKQLADVTRLTLDYIFAEANRALLAYEKKYNRAVGKVYLVGGGAALKGLTEVAKDSFRTDVVAGDPFGKLATPAFLTQSLKETGPEFAVAIGLALRKLQELG